MNRHGCPVAGAVRAGRQSVAPAIVLFIQRGGDGRYQILDPATSEAEWLARAGQRRGILQCLDRCERGEQ